MQNFEMIMSRSLRNCQERMLETTGLDPDTSSCHMQVCADV